MLISAQELKSRRAVCACAYSLYVEGGVSGLSRRVSMEGSCFPPLGLGSMVGPTSCGHHYLSNKREKPPLSSRKRPVVPRDQSAHSTSSSWRSVKQE